MKYFEMFTGVGGFSLGIPLDWNCVGFSEIDKYACQVLKYRFPKVKNFGDVTKLDGSKLPDFDVLTAGFPCFAKDTLIITKRGMVPIQNVIVGDEVFTHKKRWKKVLKTFITHDRDIRVVEGHGLIETKTTDEHPYYCRKKNLVWENKIRRYVRKFDNPIWLEAKFIKDYFVGRVCPSAPRIEGDENFWWIVGRYLADGWLVNRIDREDGKTCRVVISCGKHEANEIEPILEKKFHYCKVEERTVYKYHITNKKFAAFLKPAGRGAVNKCIPISWFGMDDKQAKAFIEGYISGDGTVDLRRNVRSIVTTSKKLALGISLLYQRVYNVLPSTVLVVPSKTKIIENRIVNQNHYYRVQFPTRNREGFVEDDIAWGCVRKNEVISTKETVYNIEVEDDNSYIANGVIVHNCQSWSMASEERAGLDDLRGTLIFDVIRILKEKQPKAFILENVAGFLTLQKSKPALLIFKELSNVGYAIDFDILNACDFGVPQHRERVFIVGKRLDFMNQDVIYEENRLFEKEYYNLPSRNQDFFIPVPNLGWDRYQEIKGYYSRKCKPKIFSKRKIGERTGGVQKEKSKRKETARSKGSEFGRTVQGIGEEVKLGQINKPKHSTNRVYSEDGLVRTIRANAGGKGAKTGLYEIDGKVRRLTPLETERAMGWPDDWTKWGLDEIGKEITMSDNQRYKMCGNGVVSNVVRAIVDNLYI